MHRSTSALVLLALLLAGCGHHAAPIAAASATPSTCAADGTWTLATDYSEDPLEVTIEAGQSESLEPSNDGPGRAGAQLVQVDRENCRLHVVTRNDTRYSDDAGDRREGVTLEVELDGDHGRVTGRYWIYDTSEEPTTDVKGTVSGTATRRSSPE